MEEVARYECVYHRNSKDFKDKNKKANCWDKRLTLVTSALEFQNLLLVINFVGKPSRRFYFLPTQHYDFFRN